MQYFTVEEILELHFMIIEDYGGSHGVRDDGRVMSLAEVPKQVVFGIEQYETIFEKAAVYMRNCIADHPFADGNKRTGTTLAVIFLSRQSTELIAEPVALEDFAVRVAVERLDVADIASWLEQYSV